jgi:DNA-binding PadR family transcriptional regulator
LARQAVKYPLLALLEEGAAHGYELKAAFDSRYGDAWPTVNIGQIYSTLQRHERDGNVTVEVVPQPDRPDKKVYHLTAEGRAALREWLEGPARTSRLRDQFFLKFLLAADTGLADPFELLERHRATALRALRDLGEAPIDTTSEAALLIEGAALHLQADIRWLDRCEEYLSNRHAASSRTPTRKQAAKNENDADA